MNDIDKRKQLKALWDELPLPRVSWEELKRIAARHKSVTATIHQAIKQANKQKS